MKWTRVALVFGAFALLFAATGVASAASKCDGADIANGPFAYTALGVTQTTFTGSGGASVSTSFSITAPSVAARQQTSLPDVFPGEGQSPCTATAFANIGVMEIEKVGDAGGNTIDPVEIDLSSTLGQLFVGAFSLSPSSHTFGVGDSVTVSVGISNPGLSDLDYGDYDVKLAAQAPGAGIGVGDGFHFLLRIRGVIASDVTPPVVTVTKPTGDEILGVIAVEVKAYDPDTPLPATGLASMSASVSSAGGTVSNLAIPLTLDYSLPVAAGIANTVTGSGSFTPTGGSGPAGTTLGSAFTATSHSGIGNYTISARATDVAGNTGYGNKNFNVTYDVAFSRQFSAPNCQTGGNGSCTGQFAFAAKRSSVTSDGAFMYDLSVEVKLVRNSDNAVMATHSYGTGAIHSDVQVDATPAYKTNFRRGDLVPLPSGPAAYHAEVYFLDVDGNLVLQGKSGNVTF